MRMWMVEPKKMCDKHLLGEHVELHMLVGNLKRKRRLLGYAKNNCLETGKIWERHSQLAAEMKSRRMRHKSRLEKANTYYLTKEEFESKVDSGKSLVELKARCANCRKNSEQR